MAMLLQGINRYRVLGVLLIIVCFTTMGCEYFPESTFALAKDSRLPKWIPIPSGLTRNDISVTMSYYIYPWGGRAKFILLDANKQILKKTEGKVGCNEPFYLKNPPQGFPPGYPAYEAITVNGVTEIIEHRNMEPLFYITDDPAVWRQYLAIGCG